MRRLLWIVFIFVGGTAALMVASILLQQHAGRPGDDLRSTVLALHDALAEWDYARVQQVTDGLPPEAYRDMSDRAHGGAEGLRWFEGTLAAMEAFPSVRFPDVKPDRVDVQYEVIDGETKAAVGAGFVPLKEGGWFMKSVMFRLAEPEGGAAGPIVFREGDNAPLAPMLDRLFESLVSGTPETFRALVILSDNTPAAAARAFDLARSQVMTCRSDRLRRMLPAVGSLPRGTRWLRVSVAAKVDEKPLWLDFAVQLGEPPRVGRFACGVPRERASGPPPPGPRSVPPGPATDNAR